MSTVEEIEKAIDQLPKHEFLKIREWVQNRFEDEWDQEFENDALSGNLDALAEQALAEHRAGNSLDFPQSE